MCIGMANGGKQVANDCKTMLLQRAIESAKNRVYYIDVNSMGDISYHHHKKAENQKELLNITVDALEKQIPKKSKLLEERYTRNFIFGCQNCNEFVKFNQKYCVHCGQALDWSGTE